MLTSLCNQSGQVGAIVPRRLPGILRQDQLPIDIDHHQPLQPVAPRHRLPRMVIHPAHEVSADCALCQSRTIHGYRSPTSPPPGHATHDFLHHRRHIGRIEPHQKAIERGVIRNGFQPQSGTKSPMLAQPDLGFAESSIFVTNQAKHNQQLRLRKRPLAEISSRAGNTARLTSRARRPNRTSPTSAIYSLRRRQNCSSLTCSLQPRTLTYRGCQQSQIASCATSAREFCRIIRQRDAAAGPTWRDAASSGLLSGLAKHLCRDEAAFLAALRMPWSNGPVEGQIHRLKLIKRSMYGRAKFDLLSLRVLPAA